MIKAGFIGLVGQPNAGKSSLMNFLIEERVSIVTPKPQTTRRRILGIYNDISSQIVFIDAPGLVKASKGLNAFLEKEAHEVINESDGLIAVLSLDEKMAENNEEVLQLVAKSKKPWMAIITKTDLSEYAHRSLILKEMVEKFGGKSYSLSTTLAKKDNSYLEDKKLIIEDIKKLLPDSEAPLFDTEVYTTENVRALCEEIVREKCFENLTHELPYQIAVMVRKFDENTKPCPKIYIDILVAKDSQKAIVIGQKAQKIKTISTESRKEIEKMMNEKVYLELNVVVKENWYDQHQTMKELGYIHERK